MNDTPDIQRRVLLHGVLAAGATLLFAGCDRQESEAPADAAAPGTPPPMEGTSTPQTDQSPTDAAPPTDAAAPPAGAPAKVSKAQAQYQDTPKGDQKCSNCRFFVADSNTCTVVEGEISPDGWSALWVPI